MSDHSPNLKNNFYAALLLHVIVLICWVAYTFYQPRIFDSLGLNTLSQTFQLYQSWILVFVPIVAGLIADLLFSKNQNFIFLILIGLMFTACIFLASASVLFSKVSFILPYIPAMMILWIIGMNIFYLPGLNVLAEKALMYNPKNGSAYTGATTDLIYALAPFFILLFDFIGAPLTFGLGAVLLLLLFFVFKNLHQNKVNIEMPLEQTNPMSTSIALALLVGVGLGFVHHYQLHHIEFSFLHISHEWLPSIILTLVSVSLFFLHNTFHRFGFTKSFVTGIVLCVISYLLSLYHSSIILEYLSFILLIVGLIPVSGAALGAAMSGVSIKWRNTIAGFLLSSFNLLGLF